MIIKIQNGEGWRILDGLNNVQFWPMNEQIDQEKVRTTEYDEVYYGVSDDAGFPNAVGISARRNDGKSILVLANLSVYLLNDNGKTIERLN